MNLTPEQTSTARLLADNSVSPSVACDLARDYPCAQVRQQVAWLPYRDEKIANKAGMLRKAITERWSAPARWEEKQERERERHREQERAARAREEREREQEQEQEQQRRIEAFYAGLDPGEQERLRAEAVETARRENPVVRQALERYEQRRARGEDATWAMSVTSIIAGIQEKMIQQRLGMEPGGKGVGNAHV